MSTDPATPAAPSLDPEVEAKLQIQNLKDDVQKLEQEIRTLRGKAENLSRANPKQIQVENEELTKRVDKLIKALYAVSRNEQAAKTAEEGKSTYDALHQSALKFFKAANISEDLWKSIES